MLFTWEYYGWGWWLKTRSSPSELIYYFFPFVYLIFGFLLSIVRVNRRLLIRMAAILNLPIVAYGFYLLTIRGLAEFDVVWLGFIALWTLLCVTSYKKAVSSPAS